MVRQTFNKAFAYLAVLAVFALGLWLAFSGIRSFVLLEWASATDTAFGRALYASVLGYFALRLLRDDE